MFLPLWFCFSIKFICKHYALLPHREELVSDMSHIATSAQTGGDASIAGGQHAAFAFSTRNQKHLFSNPGMLSNLVLRHWHIYRLRSHSSVEMKMPKLHSTRNKHKQSLKDRKAMTFPAVSVVAEDGAGGRQEKLHLFHSWNSKDFAETHSIAAALKSESQLGKRALLAFKSESDLSFCLSSLINTLNLEARAACVSGGKYVNEGASKRCVKFINTSKCDKEGRFQHCNALKMKL